MELIAECKCKAAAAETCYKQWLEKGIMCPKPTPTVCGVLARAEETATFKPAPTPSVVPPIRRYCGGFAGLQCPTGMRCVDDPRDTCDPKKGGADCMGICVGGSEKIPCAGKIGGICPEGWACVDDPTDTCDPAKGGRDCGGVCVVEDGSW
ncbi:hypothetical protein K458DRAFT_483358 [Lentithecium fluviatile CBS 122367]|uniref:Uncharacterized protein n=1 Tax=Lentithecium fluviatile CBS 122367 TaxID=1168545 RepID=A0A6G1JM77_9PLEO|nr:hypothetical protein K458DRAFT_483358 [Lentithecium fluviatile CBS 122367]